MITRAGFIVLYRGLPCTRLDKRAGSCLTDLSHYPLVGYRQLRTHKHNEKKETGSSSAGGKESGEGLGFDEKKAKEQADKFIKDFLAGKRPVFDEKFVDGKRIRVVKMEGRDPGRYYLLLTLGFLGGLLLVYLFTSSTQGLGATSTAQHEFSHTLTGPCVSNDEFITKFLEAGEVKRIVFFPRQRKAVGVLQRGAIIGGEEYPNHVVCVDLPGHEVFLFRSRIREAEQSMGISPSDHMPIEEFHGGASPAQSIVSVLIALGMLYLGMKTGRQAGLMFREAMMKKAEKPKKD